MLGMRDGLGEQYPHVVVMQRVDDLAALALAHHESQIAQHPQLLGDRGLTHLDVVRQLAHRARASA